MKSCVSTLTNALLCHSFSVLPGQKTAVLDFWRWTQITVLPCSESRQARGLNEPVCEAPLSLRWRTQSDASHCCSSELHQKRKHRRAEWKPTRGRCETAKTSAATESVTVLLGAHQNDRRVFFVCTNKDTCRRRYRLLPHISRLENKRGCAYERRAPSS